MNNSTKTRNIIIVATCISTAIICIALTFWGNYKNDGVLSPDAFYGVLATFIGICATIIVGFQIASFVKLHETEKQIQIVQYERNKMLHDKEKFQNEIKSIRKELSNAFVAIAQSSTDIFIQMLAYIIAISCFDIDATSSRSVLSRYRQLYDTLQKSDQHQKRKVSEYVYKLKDLSIPNDIENYAEIMGLHLKIIQQLEEVKNTIKE